MSFFLTNGKINPFCFLSYQSEMPRFQVFSIGSRSDPLNSLTTIYTILPIKDLIYSDHPRINNKTISYRKNKMSGVKEKANADNNPLVKEVEACAMNTALQPESLQAESRKRNKMSDDSQRMHKISWNSTTGRMKARAIRAGIQKGGRATTASLGRKSSKGVELPYLELPEPEDMRNLSDTDLEIYTIKRKCKHQTHAPGYSNHSKTFTKSVCE